jgi:hypothetical protein
LDDPIAAKSTARTVCNVHTPTRLAITAMFTMIMATSIITTMTITAIAMTARQMMAKAIQDSTPCMLTTTRAAPAC